MSDDRSDWFRPTTIDGEPAYLMTREGVVFYTMKTDGKVATQGQVEIANIVAAWWRGEIFPRSAAPTMAKVFDAPAWEELPPEPPAPTPIAIAGGVAGLQKFLIQKAKENRGLDHAALKELFDNHQVVMAVWEAKGELSSPIRRRRR
jgi:hypothetical protein